MSKIDEAENSDVAIVLCIAVCVVSAMAVSVYLRWLCAPPKISNTDVAVESVQVSKESSKGAYKDEVYNVVFPILVGEFLKENDEDLKSARKISIRVIDDSISGLVIIHVVMHRAQESVDLYELKMVRTGPGVQVGDWEVRMIKHLTEG